MLIIIAIYILLIMKQLILNFQTDTEAPGEMMISSSPGASRNYASHTARQENDLAKKMTVTSGLKCLEQLERFPRATSWAKTFAALLIGTGDWYSTRCKLIWKLKATKSHRFYFQLVPSTPRTDGIGFGLLLTPSTVDIVPDKERKKKRTEYRASVGRQWTAGSLTEQVFHGMIPTPTAMDATSATATMKSTQVKEGSMHSMTLTRLLCTPTAQASRGNTSDKRGKGNLTDQIAEMDLTTSKTSQLNPQFVAEMMGFPPNWTELPFQSGETNQSKPTETQ